MNTPIRFTNKENVKRSWLLERLTWFWYIYVNSIIQCNEFKFRFYLISNEKKNQHFAHFLLYQWRCVGAWVWLMLWLSRLWMHLRWSLALAVRQNHRTVEKFIFIAFLSKKKVFTTYRINVTILLKKRMQWTYLNSTLWTTYLWHSGITFLI